MGLLSWTVCLISIALVINHCVKYWYRWGYHKVDQYNHAPGPCHYLEGPGTDSGSEDLTVLPNGLVLISSGLWRDKGRILLYDFNGNRNTVQDLPIEGHFDRSSFRPHGLSAWVDPNTYEVTVFVVNHPPEGDRVEIFKFLENERKLRHLRTISDPIITSAELNDVVGVDSNRFFASKAYHYPAGFKQNLEKYLMTAFGSIVYYDGTQVRDVETGFNYANGINISPDQKYLYLVEYVSHVLHIYKINSDKSLTKHQKTTIDATMDNIEVDPLTGNLWIGAHHSITKLLKSLNDPAIVVSSQVLKVELEDGLVKNVVEAYYNTGEQLSGATVAAVYKGKMIIGSLFHKLLVCDIRYVL